METENKLTETLATIALELRLVDEAEIGTREISVEELKKSTAEDR